MLLNYGCDNDITFNQFHHSHFIHLLIKHATSQSVGSSKNKRRLKIGSLYVLLKITSYHCNEDRSGWHGEFDCDYKCIDEFEYNGYDHILFIFLWIIHNNSVCCQAYSIYNRDEWIV